MSARGGDRRFKEERQDGNAIMSTKPFIYLLTPMHNSFHMSYKITANELLLMRERGGTIAYWK